MINLIQFQIGKQQVQTNFDRKNKHNAELKTTQMYVIVLSAYKLYTQKFNFIADKWYFICIVNVLIWR